MIVRIPSVLWQFAWAWFFGPLLLWQTRKIQDTHFWALQTRLAVLAGYVKHLLDRSVADQTQS